MATITILIRHSGKWSEENCYVEYSIDGIVLKEYASYSDLVDLISVQLNVDLTKKCIKIKYTVEGNNTPMEIRNDMGVCVYVQLKKINTQFGVYPLCVSIFDIDIVYSDSGETSIEGDVLQLEYNQELIGTNDTLPIVPTFGDQPVDAFDVGNDLIITNRSQKEIMIDQIYMDKSTLKDVMEKYSTEKRFKFLVERSNSISYTLVCQSKECPWLMKASSINKSKMFRIRVFNSEHTCPLKDGVHSDCRATSGLIGGIIAPKLRNHKRKYTPNDIRDDVRLDLGIDINYMLAWRAKEKALELIMGQPAASYGKLPGYLYTLDKTYPGNILPLAYGVIDSENDASWTWFFEQFKEANGERENIVTQTDFDKLMKRVEQFDVRVKNYLELVGYEKWARLYAPVPRGWVMTLNIAECINSTLVAARELPIFDFLEQVHLMFARWNCTNRKNASCTFTLLGKKFQEMLVLNESKSGCMMVVPSTDYIYSVSDEGKSYIVCLEKKTCSCNRFQVDGIPCAHAWRVLNKKHMLPDEYCSDFYKPETILRTYEVPVYPLPDKSEWNIPEHIDTEVVLPPKYKRPPGRPKKQREKSFSEFSKRKGTNSCSTCGQRGHNRRSCRTATWNA
ncbi:uncharacterized protein LOC125873853 [Solanum stenotomum]|uniref:uncharacterized protein LOC125873853 n=1 Tax=Solanum stenotomum TaxID=172797 RepID=UPI0020D17440|nr:uncharacterized protein LOC125873853 [Solanum stenotomum]